MEFNRKRMKCIASQLRPLAQKPEDWTPDDNYIGNNLSLVIFVHMAFLNLYVESLVLKNACLCLCTCVHPRSQNDNIDSPGVYRRLVLRLHWQLALGWMSLEQSQWCHLLFPAPPIGLFPNQQSNFEAWCSTPQRQFFSWSPFKMGAKVCRIDEWVAQMHTEYLNATNFVRNWIREPCILMSYLTGTWTRCHEEENMVQIYFAVCNSWSEIQHHPGQQSMGCWSTIYIKPNKRLF